MLVRVVSSRKPSRSTSSGKRGRVLRVERLEQRPIRPLVGADPTGDDDRDEPGRGLDAPQRADCDVERRRRPRAAWRRSAGSLAPPCPPPAPGRAPPPSPARRRRTARRATPAGAQRDRRKPRSPRRTQATSRTPRAGVGAIDRLRPAPRDGRSTRRRARWGLRAQHREDRRRLLGRLACLGRRIGIRDDPAADAEPHALAAHLERADRDAELEPRGRRRDPDRAGVDLAARRLELRDHRHRRDLRRTGHRPRRERRAHELCIPDTVAQLAHDLRHHVPHARVRAHLLQRRGAHRPRPAHPPEVVAHEVDDHHVLGAVLVRRDQRRPLFGGRRRIGRPRARSLDRRAAHRAPVALQEQLRRHRYQCPPRPRHEGAAVGRQRRTQPREQVQRRALKARLESHREVRLVEVAGRDPLDARRDGARIARRRRRPRPPRRR